MDHEKVPALKIPDQDWFEAVMPLLSTKVRAVLLLITLHGLRISEAVERKPADLDTNKWRLTIPDTKSGEPVRIPLSQPVIEAIREIMAEKRAEDEKRKAKGKLPRRTEWLFGTGSRRNISRDIAKACVRAGVASYGTHAAGRHSFATRVLDHGKSLKFLMAAGRWKTANADAEVWPSGAIRGQRRGECDSRELEARAAIQQGDPAEKG